MNFATNWMKNALEKLNIERRRRRTIRQKERIYLLKVAVYALSAEDLLYGPDKKYKYYF